MPTVHGEDCVIRILDKESHVDRVQEPAPRRPRLRRRRRSRSCASSSASPTAWCWSPGRPAAARPPRSTPRSPRSSRPRTRSSPSRTRSSTSCSGITQIPVNEKKGLTFARGLRSILRHDPDKIMVGEIRDEETAQIAIQSALTGHLVFTTVHANNVIDVLGRFLNMNVDLYNFVSALNCVLAQRLVRRICPALPPRRPRSPSSCSRSRGWRRRSTATTSSTRAAAAWSATAPASSAGSRSRSCSTCPTASASSSSTAVPAPRSAAPPRKKACVSCARPRSRRPCSA